MFMLSSTYILYYAHKYASGVRHCTYQNTPYTPFLMFFVPRHVPPEIQGTYEGYMSFSCPFQSFAEGHNVFLCMVHGVSLMSPGANICGLLDGTCHLQQH